MDVNATPNIWPEVDEQGLPLKIKNTRNTVKNGFWVSRNIPLRYLVPLVKDSHVAQLIISALKKLRSAKMAQWGSPQYFNNFMYRREYLPRTHDVIQRVKKLFGVMATLARRKSIPLLVIMIPAFEQVHPEKYEFDAYPFMKDCDMEKPQKIFSKFFDEKSIPYLDLLPAMKDKSSDHSLYFEVDLHWNRQGNQVVGEIITAYLIKHGYIALKD